MNEPQSPKIADLSDFIFDIIPDMLILCNEQTLILDVLHPKRELLCGNTEFFIGHYLTEDHLKALIRMDHFNTVIRSRQSSRFTLRHKDRTDGKIYFYEVSLFYLKTCHVLAHIRTIPEESVNQIESEHLRYFFAEVLDYIAIPISVKCADTECYIYWSKKAEIFGRTAEEMVGHNEELFMSPERARLTRQIDRQLVKGKNKQYEGIEKFITTDGEEHTFLITRTLFTFGTEKLILASALDISELTETRSSLVQAKNELARKNMVLSSVLSLAKVIPWNGNLKEHTLSCAYDTYHPVSAQGPDKKGCYTVSVKEYLSRIHPDYRANAADLYADLAEGYIAEFHDIYPIHWYNDQEYEWIEVQCSTFQYDAEKKPVLSLGSARVITAQKRMEKSLCVAKEQAEQSNTLKSAFLANMSHEIRTPLNAIIGFSELLAEASNEEEKKEYLTIIQNSNALLLQLIGDILDLSKIEAGTLEFVFGDHNLNDIMEELEQTSRMKITNPAIEIACTHQIPNCTIHTDRGRLLQVMHNFINNAIKFTQQGHIHFGFRQHSDGRWYFYVEDTGRGIASDKLEHVFDRFVKLDTKTKGTGLGLAISKSIVERLNGEIGVYSAEGHGSTFWFLLPANSIITSVPIRTPEKPHTEPSRAVPDQSPLLIAEDDFSNYKLFEAMLKKHYTLLHAWNGREAVEMFKKHHPFMIFMDIKMPEMDGYEATAAIRKISATVPIIAVTAFAYPEDMRRILASGFNGCLPKPVNSEDLKNKISELHPIFSKTD